MATYLFILKSKLFIISFIILLILLIKKDNNISLLIALVFKSLTIELLSNIYITYYFTSILIIKRF